jgi:threonylcarbamoyladenosine tRNA methylthiotransferase MtaB
MQASKKKKFRIEVLGCRTNQYEAQAFRTQLQSLGYEEAQDGEEAELCIVNTCTVTESADSSSRNTIRQLAKHNPNARLYVTGCLAERSPETLRDITGITQIVSNAKKEQLIESIFPEEIVTPFAIENFDSHTRAFVKVQDGCNSFCTYCIIPYVRGRSRSRHIDDIVQEVEGLVKNGYKEIVLTGINIGDFDGGKEGGPRLAELIRTVDQIPGVERIRVSSIDPDEVDHDLQSAILDGKHTCHSMHLVLQAGSNLVLKRMNRKYTRQIFLETVRRMQHASPDFTVTTDVIVGFPGETEQDFEETLQVMDEVQFAKVHMFPYSERPRTKAALYPNKVPQDLIHARKRKVLERAEHGAFLLREKFVGRTMRILTEEGEGDVLFGYTDNFLRVKIPKMHHTTNELLHVELYENRPDCLLGKVI